MKLRLCLLYTSECDFCLCSETVQADAVTIEKYVVYTCLFLTCDNMKAVYQS